MSTISFPHTNPRGQMIRKGGMWLVNCQPGCQMEFRSPSDEKMIRAQLESAGWQVNEERPTNGTGKPVYTYRCPGIESSRGRGSRASRCRMRGSNLEKRKKRRGVALTMAATPTATREPAAGWKGQDDERRHDLLVRRILVDP